MDLYHRWMGVPDMLIFFLDTINLDHTPKQLNFLLTPHAWMGIHFQWMVVHYIALHEWSNIEHEWRKNENLNVWNFAYERASMIRKRVFIVFAFEFFLMYNDLWMRKALCNFSHLRDTGMSCSIRVFIHAWLLTMLTSL